MGVMELSLLETRDMFLYVSRRMIESEERLSQADREIGDGDHGVGMARGFEAVKAQLSGKEFSNLEELFKTIGMALLTSVGGAAGAVFGTLFKGGARDLADQRSFSSKSLWMFLTNGLEAVELRGGAKPGDKTMVDALEPAVRKAKELATEPLDECIEVVSEVARNGMEATRGMMARVGKAKTLGERSLGYPDPGAISAYLILAYMSEYLAQ